MSPTSPGQGTRPAAKARFCRPGALTGRPTVIPRVRSSEAADSRIPFNRSSPRGRELKYIFPALTIGQIAGDQTFSKKRPRVTG